MGTKKQGQQDVRVLQLNNSGTYSVSLPIKEIRELHWQKNQRVTIKRQGKKLIISDWNG